MHIAVHSTRQRIEPGTRNTRAVALTVLHTAFQSLPHAQLASHSSRQHICLLSPHYTPSHLPTHSLESNALLVTKGHNPHRTLQQPLDSPGRQVNVLGVIDVFYRPLQLLKLASSVQGLKHQRFDGRYAQDNAQRAIKPAVVIVCVLLVFVCVCACKVAICV